MGDTYTPPRFTHFPEHIPAELKAGETWLCCDENKVPLIAILSGACYAASSTDPRTWRSYETALAAWQDNEWSFAGVGRVIRAEEDLVGIDLDKCVEPDGDLTLWSCHILERLNTYAELSPSGTGVKAWVRAATVTRAHVKPGLEIYPRGRYFTMTGQAIYPMAVEDRSEELEAIIEEEFPKVDRDRTPYDGPKWALDLLDYLERAQVEIYAEKSDGTAQRVYSIRCPWAEEHSDGDTSGTRVGQYADGATWFRCEHAHCREVREWKQFRAELDPLVYLGRPRRSKGRLR